MSAGEPVPVTEGTFGRRGPRESGCGGGYTGHMAEPMHAIQREQLTAEREHVKGQLAHLGHDNERESFDENFADSGQVTAERGEVDAIVGALLETLGDIDAALAKMDSGMYGQCEDCGGSIAEARLEAMPAAHFCIACASKRR